MSQEDDTFSLTAEDIEAKILHILRIFPILNPTMLQSGLGPWIKSEYWRPVLDDLIERGLVLKENETVMTPTNRYNTYTKLRLPQTEVTVGE